MTAKMGDFLRKTAFYNGKFQILEYGLGLKIFGPKDQMAHPHTLMSKRINRLASVPLRHYRAAVMLRTLLLCHHARRRRSDVQV